MTSLDNIPNELALAIVMQVDPEDWYACALINRQFYFLTNPMLWHSINVDTKQRFTKLMASMIAAKVTMAKSTSANASASTSLARLSSPLGSLIRHVHLASFLTDAQFAGFIKLATRVQDLILEDAVNITDVSVRHIPTYCPDLQRLDIHHSHITQHSIKALGTCPQLSTLCVLSCPGFGSNIFHALAKCPLDNLMAYVCRFDNISDDRQGGRPVSFEDRTMTQVVSDIVGFQQLTSLALLHCPDSFVERLFSILVTNINTTTNASQLIWPHITKLSLNGCKTLSDYKAITFIKAHPRLTVFTVEPNAFTDIFLLAVPRYMSHIESLGLSGAERVTSRGVRKLIKGCPHLTQVRLYDCDMTIDDFPEANGACLDQNGYTVNLLDVYAITGINLLDFFFDGSVGD